jgi:hypothetical protein
VTSVLSLAAIVLALSLNGSLPEPGVLVAGESLGSLRLGMTQAQVRGAWGTTYGRCRNCPDPTWYFTYRKYAPAGAGVSFRRGHVVAIFTLWAPAGWRTSRGLGMGDAGARATALYGALLVVHCEGYDALVASRPRTQTAIYVRNDKVWGFGLSLAAVPVCR